MHSKHFILYFFVRENIVFTKIYYLVCRLKARVGDFSDRKLLVVGFLGRDNRSVGNQREVDSGVGHQVGLELSEIHVESTVKSERGGDGRYNLSN